MAELAQKELLTAIKGFLTSGCYSDLKVTCGGDIYRVHKVVVCSRSSFFAGSMRFSGMEMKDNRIELPEDEGAVVKLLIQYLYEGEYDPKEMPAPSPPATGHIQVSPHTCSASKRTCDIYKGFPAICQHHACGEDCNCDCEKFECSICMPAKRVDGTADQLVVHAKMYEIGDKYDVQGLKDLAATKFKLACSKFWDTPSFHIAARQAFITTPEDDNGLRDVVCSTISGHMSLLKKPEIEALAKEFNGIAFSLLKSKSKILGWC